MKPMNPRPDARVSEEELHALLDGQLDAPQRAALESRLARDSDAMATFQSWQRQRAALHELHAGVLDEAVPESLLAAAGQVGRAHRQAQQWWRWGGMAAALALAFGLGWFTQGLDDSGRALARVQPAREFVHQAAVAHAVYAPDIRHPVEVGSAEEEHLVQWLSKRLGRTLKAPKLTTQGFDLVGGRLLPGDEGARAQFMYQNARGERVTLYLGTTPEGVVDHRKGTEFRFAADGPVPAFYWTDEGFAYALSGPLARQELLQLAQAVYHQL